MTLKLSRSFTTVVIEEMTNRDGSVKLFGRPRYSFNFK